MVKAGVIGVGRIGAGFEEDHKRAKPATHIGAWARAAELVGIADVQEERAQKVAERWNTTVFPNFLSLALKCDVVSVATPPETHRDIVLEIARNKLKFTTMGPKVIWVEKPMAMNLRDAQDMIDACREKDIKLAVNLTRRWEESWTEVARLIPKHGQCIQATARYCGSVLNVGTHMADILNWFKLENVDVHVLDSDYLIFELDMLFRYSRIRVSDNGELVEIFKSEPSLRWDGINELECYFRMHYDYYRGTPMLRAAKQLAACVDTPEQPFCTGEDGFAALRRAQDPRLSYVPRGTQPKLTG